MVLDFVVAWSHLDYLLEQQEKETSKQWQICWINEDLVNRTEIYSLSELDFTYSGSLVFELTNYSLN